MLESPPHRQAPRDEGTSSYLGGVGMGDLAVSPRFRKAARTLSVSSRSPSSSEPAMGAPMREGTEGWTPGLAASKGLGSKFLAMNEEGSRTCESPREEMADGLDS